MWGDHTGAEADLGGEKIGTAPEPADGERTAGAISRPTLAQKSARGEPGGNLMRAVGVRAAGVGPSSFDWSMSALPLPRKI